MIGGRLPMFESVWDPITLLRHVEIVQEPEHIRSPEGQYGVH